MTTANYTYRLEDNTGNFEETLVPQSFAEALRDGRAELRGEWDTLTVLRQPFGEVVHTEAS